MDERCRNCAQNQFNEVADGSGFRGKVLCINRWFNSRRSIQIVADSIKGYNHRSTAKGIVCPINSSEIEVKYDLDN